MPCSGDLELRECVERRFLRAPVETVPPVIDEIRADTATSVPAATASPGA